MSWSEPPAPASALSLFLSNFHAPYYYAYNKFLALFFYPSLCLSAPPPPPPWLSRRTHTSHAHTRHTHIHTHTQTHTHTRKHTHTHTHTHDSDAKMSEGRQHYHLSEVTQVSHVSGWHSMLQFFAVCCSVLQKFSKHQHYHLSEVTQVLHVSGWHSLLQFVAVCCRISQNANTTSSTKQHMCRTSQGYIVCCSVLQCVAEFLKMPSLPPQPSYGVCTSQVDVMCCSVLKSVSEILKTPTTLPTQRSDRIVICLR